MDIRLPSQLLILAGESPEVDTLVRRATRIEGGIAPPVPAAGTMPAREDRINRVIPAENLRNMSYRSGAPIDLYRRVDQQRIPMAQAVDVFA